MRGILAEQNFSLDRLNSLLEIIDAGSIADAVDRDPSRQSLYSKHKRDLEGVLGQSLFYQKNKKLTPTEYGIELAAIVRSFERAINDLDSKHKKEKSIVSVGAGDSVFQWMLLPVASQLQDAFSDVNFSFKNLRTAEIVEGVKGNSIDFGIVRSDIDQQGIISRKVRSFDFGLFYHPRDDGELNLFEVLSRRKLVGLTGKGSYVKNVLALQKEYGLDEGFWIQVDSFPMVENALIETETAAILPLDSKDTLESIGYMAIEGNKFDCFRRKYCLIANLENLKVRSSLRLVWDHFGVIFAIG